MHGDIGFGGPGYAVVIAYVVGIALLAAWIMFDATRPKRASAFAVRPWTRWAWFAPQALFIVAFVIQALPWTVNAFVSAALLLMSPFVLVSQIVYLLRVAYPTPERLAARELAASTLRNVPTQEQDAEEGAPDPS